MGYEISQHSQNLDWKEGITTADIQKVADYDYHFYIYNNPKTDEPCLYWHGGKKGWGEESQLKKIAAIVKNGSWIQMTGEDGKVFRWFFADGKVFEQTPEKIIWNSGKEI